MLEKKIIGKRKSIYNMLSTPKERKSIMRIATKFEITVF